MKKWNWKLQGFNEVYWQAFLRWQASTIHGIAEKLRKKYEGFGPEVLPKFANDADQTDLEKQKSRILKKSGKQIKVGYQRLFEKTKDT